MSNPISISLCMIVKNEEDNLEACLSSVADIVDEINIVDTGSTDKTVEIAQKYTDRIFFFEWINDFGAARNFSFSKATKEYIMWLDADDVIYEADRQKLKQLKNTLAKNVDMVLMDYRYKKDEFGNVTINQKRERLVKNNKGFKWQGRLHENIPIEGKVEITDIGIDHEHSKPAASQARNIAMLENVIDTPEENMRDLYYYTKVLYIEKEYDKALPYMERFVLQNKKEQMPAIDAYLALHYTYLIKEDFEKAYLCLAENDGLLNNYSEYYCALGNFSVVLLKDDNTAIGYYEKALKTTGITSGGVSMYTYKKYYYYTPYFALGDCYARTNRLADAVFAYKKALEYTNNELEIEQIKHKLMEIEKSL